VIRSGRAADGEQELRWSAWMAAAHRGDRRLYERLLHEIGAAIERYVRRRFGALSFVDDCVQECLLAVHAARHTYDPARPFRPWLFALVRNKTIDLLRRSYGGRPATDDIDIDALPAAPGDEAQGEVEDILARLRPQFRSALVLTKIIGYSLSEAADRSGISETAMKTRVSRAVRAAESLLNAEREGR
jgi:RNA polymerase sigma-70 factor, ECF subfamily